MTCLLRQIREKDCGRINSAFEYSHEIFGEGFYTVSDKGVTVALSTELSPELIEEGFAREIVSKVQTMRKEAGFNVTDHINITMSGSVKVTDTAQKMSKYITADTLADSLVCSEPCGYVKSWNINGENVSIGIEKA